MRQNPFTKLRPSNGMRRQTLSFSNRTQTCQTARSRAKQSSSRVENGRVSYTALKASAVFTIVLGLVRPGIRPSLPYETQLELDAAWEAAVESGSVAEQRRTAWTCARVYLEHYFVGPFVDEGSLEADLLVGQGSHSIEAADTKLFWIPAEDKMVTPALCLAVNKTWPHHDDCAVVAGTATRDHGQYVASRMEDEIMYHLEKRLSRWQVERGFENCIVVLRFHDASALFVYGNHRWQKWDWKHIITTRDVIVQDAGPVPSETRSKK